MIINHNMQAMNSHRQLGINANNQSKSTEKLSSGMRINRAGDDAAGLSISEKMRGQIRGLNQASRNSQDGISLIQTAEGAMDEVHSMLQRMRELAVQSANDTNTQIDRDALQAEVVALQSEISDISTRSEFNEQKLLDGTFADKQLQIGANAGQTMSISIKGLMSTVNQGLQGTWPSTKTSTVVIRQSTNAASAAVDVTSNTTVKITASGVLPGAGGSAKIDTVADANKAISSFDAAIKAVSTERSKLGAVQNRLEHTIKNLDNSAENLQASESRIRDVDMAKEMMDFTKTNVLNQAAQAMLAQANQLPNQVLSLLR